MLTHKNYGNLLMNSMWTNPWTRQMWGGFMTYEGQYVNLPLSEVKILDY